MRRLAAILAAALACSPALAGGWQISHGTNGLTDKPFAVAVLHAASGPTSLRVANCTNGVELMLPPPRGSLYNTELGVNFRLDDGPVVPRFAFVSRGGTVAYLWPGPSREGLDAIRHAKRLRVVIADTLLDFDLTGAREAISAVGCR